MDLISLEVVGWMVVSEVILLIIVSEITDSLIDIEFKIWEEEFSGFIFIEVKSEIPILFSELLSNICEIVVSISVSILVSFWLVVSNWVVILFSSELIQKSPDRK